VASLARPERIGLKRFIRPGGVISIIGHVGALLLGLLFAGANSYEPKPPDSMTVDIVRPDEVPPDQKPPDQLPPDQVPRPEGTPLESTTFGSELSSDSDKGSAAQSPLPNSAAQSPRQPQPNSDPQRDARQVAARPQTAQPKTAQPRKEPPRKEPPRTAQPDTPQPETQPQASEPLLPPDTPPVPPRPHAEASLDQPDMSEMFAMPLALPGGRLGGGFDAPAADPAKAAHDDTAAFRARVSSCSALPAGINDDEKIKIVLRVSLKPDGALASVPQLVQASASPKAAALMQSAVSALQKCQPYTMLPAEKYEEWKTLDLVFTPLNFSSR
jgi:hypothetical protein